MHTVTRALVALGLVLTLGACGGEGDPGAAPPSSPSLSPSVTPPTAPPHETARQFIYRWVELERYMQLTGDSSAFRDIASRCESCTTFADRVDKIYSRGGSIRTGGSHVLGLRKIPSVAGTVAFRVRLRADATTFRESAAADPERLDGGLTQMQLILRNRGGWRIDELSVVAQ